MVDSGPYGTTISDTSHEVTLNIPIPPSGSLTPGSNLDVTLSIPSDVLSGISGDVEFRIEGKSSVEIMGKPRYQRAQLLNAGMGGSAMPITGREEHLFALHTLALAAQSEMQVRMVIPPQKTCSCSHDTEVENEPGTGIESGIMPTIGTKGDLGGNRVTWKLKAEIKRKGVLKRDIKLSIEIPVSLPLPAPRKSPLSATTSKPISDNTPLEATLDIFPSDHSQGKQRIPFRLSLYPAYTLSSDIQVSVGISRHTWTKGIETSLGTAEGHEFAGIMVGSLSPGKSGPGYIELRDGEKGELVWEGEYEIGDDMRTVRGCGLRLSWSMQAQIRCKELGPPMVSSQVVHLPHFTRL